MKKIIYFLVFLIIFIPNVVFADIYDVATSKAERYILSNDYANTYERYIIPNSGELLSYNEFLLTLESKKNTPKANAYSYLYDGTKYWTSSKLNNKYYVVNSVETLYENTNDTPKTRVVETVNNDTIVSGSGNITNPWTFKYIYNVELSSNDLIKGRVSLFPCNNNIEEKSITLLSDSDKVAYLCAKPGYKYIDNTCDDILVKNNNVISIRKLSRDMNCVVNFGIDTMEITLESYEGDKVSNPSVLYLAYSKGWYLDKAGIKSIKKLVTLPEKTGYKYVGYYTEKNGLGTKVIDESGNILKGNEKLFSESSKIYPNFKAISYNISYNANGGSGSMENTTHTYDQSSTLRANTFTWVDHVFLGWSTNPNATSTTYSNSQSVKNLSIVDGEIVKLYAIWREIIYTCSAGTLTNNSSLGHICIGYSGITASYSTPYQSCYTYSYTDTCTETYASTCYTTTSSTCNSSYSHCTDICYDCYPMTGSCSGASCYCPGCCCYRSCTSVPYSYTCQKTTSYTCYITRYYSCTKYAQACDTYYSTTYYCPTGWSEYSGSGSSLVCYKAANAN